MSRTQLALALVAFLIVPATSFGQGLIFSLPQPGQWIRFEGKVKQSDARPERPDGVEELNWDRHLTIKALGGAEMATFRGQEQPCRWIEIKVVTGHPSEVGLRGPTRIYKVLVPESIIDGKSRDGRGVPVDMLPIVKGMRQLDNKQPVPIRANALRIYPTVSLLAHYTDPVVVAEQDNPAVPIGAITARQLSGKVTMERKTSRTSNEGTYWLSKDVPFGLVSWKVKMTREVKDQTDPRSAFRQVSQVEVEMSVHETGEGAETEIVDP